MIEARSCERFKVLSENIQDEELALFYRDLMESEAGHYTTLLRMPENTELELMSKNVENGLILKLL
jgi:tRNA isopentenyl-2-thiomethyl-A-37 hydroxylase MiaE